MSTTPIQSDDFVTLRNLVRQLYGRTELDRAELDRTALRLSNYLRTGDIEITATSDVFGVAGDATWIMIQFNDGLEPMVLPTLRARGKSAPS